MAWSTREIAELAGISLRSVRHYHEIGLLDEPERQSNGYKQYSVSHLLHLLRIKRLSALGFSLARISEMRSDADPRADLAELRALDDELAATIERLQQARTEVGALLRRTSASDLPLRFASLDDVAELPEPDRSFVSVIDTVLGPRALDGYADLLQQKPDPVATELDDLPADADESTRRSLAERLVPYVRALRVRHAGLDDLASDAPHGRHVTARTMEKAIGDLYNPAQVDVMRRVGNLLGDRGLPQ
ncbi:MerR family transcriptional regulator [Streptomyces rubiginosohelvolus]|uniref:MerR family transcriptional regulator n=1 Tax=Streptomyces rubiginosohelvolus TaxID=67362 RepID=A0ABW6FAE6_9ACTN